MKPSRALWLLSYLFLSVAVAQAAPAAGDGAAASSPGRGAEQDSTPKGTTADRSLPASGAAAGEPPSAGGAAADGKAPANGAPADPKAVSLKADTLSLDVQSDSYLAKGGVKMVQDGVSLLADSVTYRRLTGDALAEGNIFMEKSGDTLKGDRLSINLLTERGELSNGELFVKKSNFRMRGQLLQKTGEEDYRVQRGSFTTCDGPKPSWRFEARDIDVTLEQFATARDAVFYAGDLPLLYTPYLIFPVKTERQSGLLIPKLGRSSKKGFYLNQPYYWAIDPSQDATFDLDVESSRGAGLGGDYRYMRAKGSEGRVQGFGIYDTNKERFRGQIDQNHLELLPNTTIASSIHAITDRSYFIDYGDVAGEYNRQLLESTIFVDHRWERYTLDGEVRYTQDLQGASNDTSLQRLPSIGFIAAGEKLGPLFFSMDSGFTNFERIEGVEGQRLELHPRLSYYAKPTSLLDLSMYGGYHERLYNGYGDAAQDGTKQVGQGDAGAVLSMPLERIYNGRLRHVLIPSVGYTVVQHRKDDDVPFFDWNDRVLGQSLASWSIASVFTGKFAATPDTVPEYRDLLYLRLSQGYQFSGQRRDLLTLVDAGHHLTDLMLEARSNPLKNINIEFDGRYNPVDNNVSTANVSAEYKGEGSNLAGVAYRYSREQVEYLEARLGFPIGKRLSATVLGRYSIDKGGFLESRYALEYKRQCWSLIAAYSDRVATSTISANREFTVNFTLYGVGALGKFRAF